eukprot:1136944-Pelagomonas_calceolata.AAC.1
MVQSVPATPSEMVCEVTLFLFGSLRLQVRSQEMVLACWAAAACRLGKGLASGQYLSSTRSLL